MWRGRGECSVVGKDVWVFYVERWWWGRLCMFGEAKKLFYLCVSTFLYMWFTCVCVCVHIVHVYLSKHSNKTK